MSATIISFVSSKGGPGKSTLTCLTAINLAENGAKVAVLDADPSGRMTKVSKNGNGGLSKYFTVFPDVTADNLVRKLETINNDFDYILIDPEGVLTDLIVKIARLAHIIISPTKISDGDIDESVKTQAVIKEVGLRTDRDINHYFAINDVSTTRSSYDQHYLNLLRESDIKVFETIIHTRVAYKETPSLGMALLELEPKRTKANNEVTALVLEIVEAIKSHYGIE